MRSLTLGAFRPINPDTKLCVGKEIFISLSQIADVTAENAVLTITTTNKNKDGVAEHVRLMVGNVPGLASASLIGKDAGSAEGDVSDGNNMVFTVDPDAATAVAASLKELRHHLKRHFAFSPAAACISQSMQKASSSSSTAPPPSSPGLTPQQQPQSPKSTRQ